MAQHITDLLKNFIPSEHNWKLALFEKWPSIIGKLEGKVRIEKILNNVLVLGVCHPAWAQELLLLSPMLKKKINALFNEEKITVIRFKTVSFNKKIRKPRFVQAFPKNNAEPIVLNSKERLTLNGVKNENLKKELERYCLRCKHIKGVE
jgi:hypothetical protein